METENDDLLLELAAQMSRAQGLHFDSLKEAEQHNKKSAQQILSHLQKADAGFTKGLTMLSEGGAGFVANVCRQLLDNLKNPEQMQAIIRDQIFANPQSFELFSEAVNSYYDHVNYDTEECIIAVFLMLFPMHSQPYACYATLIWRRDGVEAAGRFYEQIVDVLKDPVLDYFAAHCLLNTSNKQMAKSLLQRALVAAQKSPHQYAELLPQIRALMQ